MFDIRIHNIFHIISITDYDEFFFANCCTLTKFNHALFRGAIYWEILEFSFAIPLIVFRALILKKQNQLHVIYALINKKWIKAHQIFENDVEIYYYGFRGVVKCRKAYEIDIQVIVEIILNHFFHTWLCGNDLFDLERLMRMHNTPYDTYRFW